MEMKYTMVHLLPYGTAKSTDAKAAGRYSNVPAGRRVTYWACLCPAIVDKITA